MKLKLKLSIILSVLLLLSILPMGNFLKSSPSPEENAGIMLVKPALAQTAEASFLEQEAGISAYVNVGQAIDLEKAKKVFRGIRTQGDNYIIGIVELTGLPEEEFPQVYISQDGWIVAYYSKLAPSSRIMQWYGYEGGTITTTTLQDAITKISPIIGVDYSKVKGNIRYYHFKYPEATKLILSADIIPNPKKSAEDTFNFFIPFDVTCYEGSWSHYARGLAPSIIGGHGESRVKLDGNQISFISDGGFEWGYLGESQLTPDKAHNINIYVWYEGELVGVAIVFIYR